MPVLTTGADRDALTFTLEAEFAASPEKVWQLWEDPRLLEKWWGPPTWPATFVRHELRPGGESRYYMTGPDGTRAAGWWSTDSTAAPSTFTFRDGFAGDDGEPVRVARDGHLEEKRNAHRASINLVGTSEQRC